MADPVAPTILTPDNNIDVIGNVIIFTFTVPTDADSDKLIFIVELDTNATISSLNPDYKANESRLSNDEKTNGHWEVKDTGVFVKMPTGGVPSSLYGADAKVTIREQDTSNYPAIDGTWYWRIAAGDGMGTSPVYNQAIFGEVRFG